MKKTLLLTLFFSLLISGGLYSQCGNIGLVGEFSGWGNEEDLMMTQNPGNPDIWIATIVLDVNSNQYDPQDIIEVKFRENNEWSVNWGSADFPAGIGHQDGPNIPVPIDLEAEKTVYQVIFNCSTGEYSFSPCGPISLIGEFTGWAGDHFLTQNPVNPCIWETNLVLTNEMDQYPPDDIIEMKFRHNSDWIINWGAIEFPTGTGLFYGPNIPVSIDLNASEDSYKVTFDCSTGEYTFVRAEKIPLSNWALAIGLALIVGFTVFRYRMRI